MAEVISDPSALITSLSTILSTEDNDSTPSVLFASILDGAFAHPHCLREEDKLSTMFELLSFCHSPQITSKHTQSIATAVSRVILKYCLPSAITKSTYQQIISIVFKALLGKSLPETNSKKQLTPQTIFLHFKGNVSIQMHWWLILNILSHSIPLNQCRQYLLCLIDIIQSQQKLILSLVQAVIATIDELPISSLVISAIFDFVQLRFRQHKTQKSQLQTLQILKVLFKVINEFNQNKIVEVAWEWLQRCDIVCSYCGNEDENVKAIAKVKLKKTQSLIISICENCVEVLGSVEDIGLLTPLVLSLHSQHLFEDELLQNNRKKWLELFQLHCPRLSNHALLPVAINSREESFPPQIIRQIHRYCLLKHTFLNFQLAIRNAICICLYFTNHSNSNIRLKSLKMLSLPYLLSFLYYYLNDLGQKVFLCFTHRLHDKEQSIKLLSFETYLYNCTLYHYSFQKAISSLNSINKMHLIKLYNTIYKILDKQNNELSENCLDLALNMIGYFLDFHVSDKWFKEQSQLMALSISAISNCYHNDIGKQLLHKFVSARTELKGSLFNQFLLLIFGSISLGNDPCSIFLNLDLIIIKFFIQQLSNANFPYLMNNIKRIFISCHKSFALLQCLESKQKPIQYTVPSSNVCSHLLSGQFILTLCIVDQSSVKLQLLSFVMTQWLRVQQLRKQPILLQFTCKTCMWPQLILNSLTLQQINQFYTFLQTEVSQCPIEHLWSMIPAFAVIALYLGKGSDATFELNKYRNCVDYFLNAYRSNKDVSNLRFLIRTLTFCCALHQFLENNGRFQIMLAAAKIELQYFYGNNNTKIVVKEKPPLLWKQICNICLQIFKDGGSQMVFKLIEKCWQSAPNLLINSWQVVGRAVQRENLNDLYRILIGLLPTTDCRIQFAVCSMFRQTFPPLFRSPRYPFSLQQTFDLASLLFESGSLNYHQFNRFIIYGLLCGGAVAVAAQKVFRTIFKQRKSIQFVLSNLRENVSFALKLLLQEKSIAEVGEGSAGWRVFGELQRQEYLQYPLTKKQQRLQPTLTKKFSEIISQEPNILTTRSQLLFTLLILLRVQSIYAVSEAYQLISTLIRLVTLNAFLIDQMSNYKNLLAFRQTVRLLCTLTHGKQAVVHLKELQLSTEKYFNVNERKYNQLIKQFNGSVSVRLTNRMQKKDYNEEIHQMQHQIKMMLAQCLPQLIEEDIDSKLSYSNKNTNRNKEKNKIKAQFKISESTSNQNQSKKLYLSVSESKDRTKRQSPLILRRSKRILLQK